jgi:TetR/AcrR family transcriptional regulator, cholesterol catabolism regulator
VLRTEIPRKHKEFRLVLENTTIKAGLNARQQARRAQVVEAALALVRKRGPTVEMRDVAQHADIAIGTLYRYFGSKEVLVSEIYVLWRTAHVDAVIAHARAKKSDGERVRAFLHRSAALFVEEPDFIDIATAVHHGAHPDILQNRKLLERRTTSSFRSLIVDRDDRDAHWIVKLMIAVFTSYLTAWRTGEIAIEEVYAAFDETVRLLLEPPPRKEKRAPRPLAAGKRS